jgi:3-hydroxyisobutyrate dehydrogenase
MKIGFIGSGVMGTSMIGHLQNAGHELYIYTRTKSKAQELINNGCKWCETPKEVASNTELIISMVGYPSDVEAIYFGENSVIQGIKSGSYIMDMTTSTPSLAIKMYEEFKKINVGVLDAPVSGGDVGAKNAALTIMCGGDQEVFDKLTNIMEIMGSKIVLQGNAGAGQHTKMCNQIALASNMIGLMEYITYAQNCGLNPEKVIQSIGEGSAKSTAMGVYAPRIFTGDMQPGFYIKHFVKDLKIAIDECEKMQIDLPGLKLAYELYKKLEDNDHGDLGTQALIKLYEGKINE